MRASTTLALAALLTFASSARAAEDAPKSLDSPPERRAGVVLGILAGGGVAGASGYPNDAKKIDNPAWYSASGPLGGGGASFHLMGALADPLNFGFWFGFATYENAQWRSTGQGAGFRVEAFPLYRAVPRLRDLGFAAQFGVGSTALRAKSGSDALSEGTQSFLGAGVFYEWGFAQGSSSHFAVGPSLQYDVIRSPSAERHGAMLALRFVFYGAK